MYSNFFKARRPSNVERVKVNDFLRRSIDRIGSGAPVYV